MTKKLNVIELSYVIQGEGKFMGTPSLLIRMTGCNLRCDWCDSKETSWNAEKGTISESELRHFLKRKVKHVMITGGNPTHKANLKDLKKIISIARSYDKFIYIEDNGTEFTNSLDLDYVSLSPKLSNSIPKDPRYTNSHEKILNSLEQQLEQYNINYHCGFKFVISDMSNIEEVLGIIERVKIPEEKVWLMPMGRTDEELATRRKEVIQACLDYKFNYTDRLHIVVYGNKRFVWIPCFFMVE